MNKTFLTFTSGLATGLLCLTLVSANKPAREFANRSADIDGKRFTNVPIEEFFKDVARYKGTHLKLIEPKMPSNRAQTWFTKANNRKNKDPKEGSRMFIYSLETLEDFFGVIRDCAIQAEIPQSKLAIRFYYGVYPKDQQIALRNYTNLHTLFMVPNYWSESDGRYYDLDIRKLAQVLRDSSGYHNNDQEKFIRKFFLEEMYQVNPGEGVFMLDASTVKYTGGLPLQTAGMFDLEFFDEPEPPVINQGQLCPPNCPTTSSLLNVIDREYPDVDWND